MKGLKFRVWNGSEMVYDVIVGRFGVFYVNPEVDDDGLDPEDSSSLTVLNTKYDEGVEAMQFTGIKDKNKKEIWEGDIIKTVNGDWGVIVWKAPFFETTVSEDQSSLYTREWYADSEVIGNIYENPELLKNA